MTSARLRNVPTRSRQITEQERIPLLRFPYFVLRGQIAERNRDASLAEESFRLAAEDLESHQSRLQHDDLKVTFLRGRNQVYESLVRLVSGTTDRIRWRPPTPGVSAPSPEGSSNFSRTICRPFSFAASSLCFAACTVSVKN